MDGKGRMPAPEEIEEARSRVGMHLVELNEADYSVHFAREGVMLDLGAIGKGYAVDQAVSLLREAGVTSALLHGGTSTVYGLGVPPDSEGWKIAIHHPEPEKNEPLTTVMLQDSALSVSAIWGKSFQAEGKTLGHILDPRTGRPAPGAVLSAVIIPSAAESDALSTALLVRSLEGLDAITQLRPGTQALLVHEEDGSLKVVARG